MEADCSFSILSLPARPRNSERLHRQRQHLQPRPLRPTRVCNSMLVRTILKKRALQVPVEQTRVLRQSRQPMENRRRRTRRTRCDFDACITSRRNDKIARTVTRTSDRPWMVMYWLPWDVCIKFRYGEDDGLAG